MLDKITFKQGQSTLEKKSYRQLDELALMMSTNPEMKIEIAGHTDDTGSESASQKLSEERVESPADVVKKGDQVKAMVISLDKDAKKIALSIKSAGTADAMSAAELQTDSASSSAFAEKLKGFSFENEK